MTLDYDRVHEQFEELSSTETDSLALSSNFVALLYGELPNISWLGIYVARGKDLVLGPFQGPLACTRIRFGEGVCGTAAAQNLCLRIDNVHKFEGHIACDPEAKSELVIPLVSNGKVIGVLNIDSQSYGRFSDADQPNMESLCSCLVAVLENPAKNFI